MAGMVTHSHTSRTPIAPPTIGFSYQTWVGTVQRGQLGRQCHGLVPVWDIGLLIEHGACGLDALLPTLHKPNGLPSHTALRIAHLASGLHPVTTYARSAFKTPREQRAGCGGPACCPAHTPTTLHMPAGRARLRRKKYSVGGHLHISSGSVWSFAPAQLHSLA